MKGIIAAGDRLTAQAGARILQEGGNAFDAACAAMLAAPLAEPMLTSLGGGGFLLAHSPGTKPLLYDFFVDVPPQRVEEPDFFPIYVDFGTAVQEFHIGAGSTAVPGMIAGIDRLHRERGRLSMEQVIAPAVEYAREGIRLSQLQASFVKLLEPILRSTGGSQALFAPDGELIDHQKIVRNPDYADFLEAFAKEGADLFYRGEIAAEIDRYYREHGGLLRREDLENYQVRLREPLSFDYRGYRIATNPPPSAGGILIAFTLKMLEGSKARSSYTLEYVRDLIEAMAVTAEFRRTHVDPHLHDEALRDILDNGDLLAHYLLSLQSRLNLWGNTTHISVIDREGHAASVTSTNGEGSGIVVHGAGIMLNNMLGEEDLNPHGFFRWPAGVRLPSMMAPTMAFDEGNEPVLILGSAGSNRIRSAITEVIERTLRFGKGIQEAVDAPRVHYEKEEVFFEPGYDPEIVKAVNARYKTTLFEEKSLFFGGVNAVTGRFEGGADSRRGGAVEKVL
ncbi:gamma-glutamyltransferase [Nitratifractor salsuginis]|uniref:Glutathione hydrolase proenzyme n=1 Tax=Nitratifractor salsuginis (strain DSM 16511 / JCM 12458 / E9I37-1) TaxID=749222 RepID=E6X1U5_NITSE|nr:gamma-glutamyltransferase [Nitratifractor salsuginis]ADV45953.1 gamma-glutamyltransferase [Nitratifractor salsuginis DSM 16511]